MHEEGHEAINLHAHKRNTGKASPWYGCANGANSARAAGTWSRTDRRLVVLACPIQAIERGDVAWSSERGVHAGICGSTVWSLRHASFASIPATPRPANSSRPEITLTHTRYDLDRRQAFVLRLPEPADIGADKAVRFRFLQLRARTPICMARQSCTTQRSNMVRDVLSIHWLHQSLSVSTCSTRRRASVAQDHSQCIVEHVCMSVASRLRSPRYETIGPYQQRLTVS